MRSHRLALLVATVLLGGCVTVAPPTATPGQLASRRPTAAQLQSSPPAPPVNATDPATPPPTWSTERDGVRLEVTPTPDTLQQRGGIDFAVALTNERSVPLQYGDGECFVYLYVGLPIPEGPVGRTDWTGTAARFKDYVLQSGPPGQVTVGTDGTTMPADRLQCPAVDGVTSPLAPGATTIARFHWSGAFSAALPHLPGSAAFQALAEYSPRSDLVSPPPTPASCPCWRWRPLFDELRVDGSIQIAGPTRPMRTFGELVDGALANATFLKFIATHPFETCAVDLNLPPEQGRYLPAGPGWDLDVSCEHPRRFIRAEIDPWTAKVIGIDVCNVSCWR